MRKLTVIVMVDGSLITDQLYPSMLHTSLSEKMKFISCTYSEKWMRKVRERGGKGIGKLGSWEKGVGSEGKGEKKWEMTGK
jgi:hypothetical protein